ncbi:MAG: S8 family serine peptidase, partial [Xanthomonadaceae bacterium]|nr:S8 family serine peptidase [Xanthomonadaceae bacterium]
ITSASQLLDDAVRASIAAGVTYVVAAGNNSADACNYSPARIAEAITVGASTPQDSMASNSNYGACVDLFAPGTGILSAYNGSDTDSLTLSGTSMSSAHVSGIAATLLAQAPGSSPVELTDLVIANATQLPSDIDATGNNLLAYSFVELEPAPENNPVLLDVHADCNDRNRRCMFEAIIENNTVPVDTWFWDFGDGAVSNRYRAKVGHAYASDLVEVTVLLTVLLSDGQSVSAERTVTLPAFYARCCA